MNTTGPATEAHARHLANLKAIAAAADRRQYIEGVKASEGAFAAKWLTDEFGKWWESKRAQSYGQIKGKEGV